MKSTTVFLVALFFCSLVKAQYNISPGAGIDKVQLGMTVKDILKIIGEPSKTITYKEEEEDWKNTGYDLSDEVVFSISFDHVYIFENAPNQYGIWKMYTRNDSAVIFNQSSYQASKSTTDKITINNDLHFYDDSLAVKNMFGNDFEKKTDEMKNTHFIYKDKGIFFIVNENQVRNVFLFAPSRKGLPVVPGCTTETFLYTSL